MTTKKQLIRLKDGEIPNKNPSAATPLNPSPNPSIKLPAFIKSLATVPHHILEMEMELIGKKESWLSAKQREYVQGYVEHLKKEGLYRPEVEKEVENGK
jgi:hypothetical protein